jgi:hypothetical protein
MIICQFERRMGTEVELADGWDVSIVQAKF